MFSNIGWGEIFVIVILGVIIIGPERLPGVIEDVRAAIFAARKAINNAKAELNGELGGMGQEFEALRGPITTAAEWGRMGPRAAITKALFDGDEQALDDFDLRKSLRPDPGPQPAAPPAPSQRAAFDYSQVYAEQPPAADAASAPGSPAPAPQAQQPPRASQRGNQAPQDRPQQPGGDGTGGGFSWADVT